MAFIHKIRERLALRAREQKIYAEMSEISDRELEDLNLSRAQLGELAREYARQV